MDEITLHVHVSRTDFTIVNHFAGGIFHEHCHQVRFRLALAESNSAGADYDFTSPSSTTSVTDSFPSSPSADSDFGPTENPGSPGLFPKPAPSFEIDKRREKSP